MRIHHALALTAAAIVDVALVVDTVHLIVTGERTIVTESSGSGPVGAVVGSALLGLVFGLLTLVVHRERDRFRHAPRLARLARPVLLGGLAFLTLGFLTISPLQGVLGVDEGPLYDASGLVALLALTTVFGSALVLGLAVLRRNPLGLGGRVLGAIGPVIVATVGLAFVAADVASPVYCTMVVVTGVALLGVRADGGEPGDAPAPTSRRATARDASA